MKLKRAVGIDLGTTNSAIAMLSPDGGEVWLYEDKYKRKTLPSMLGINPANDSLIVGWDAWNRRVMEPQPIASIKRKMGQQKTVQLGARQMLPQEVSAKILEALRARMESYIGDHQEDSGDRYLLDQAVVTVPAYFDAPQIEATRKAGELAGLEVVSLLQPTAAAMYHAWKHGIGDGTFLVYDLGGGTFDVSIIRCLMGEYQVLGIDGDNYLGGDDFDRRLAEFFRQELVEQGYALDLNILDDADDARRFILLKRLAQEVKEALSTSEFQYIGRRDIFEDQEGQPVTLEMEFGREQFEELIADLVDQSVEACQRALAKSNEAASVTIEDIDFVLLVGGSTRVPLVQQKVHEAFCAGQSKADEPLLDEPDTCVALGAAIHAANVAGLTIFEEDQPSTRPAAALQITSPLSHKGSLGRLIGRLQNAQAAEDVESVALLHPSGDLAAVVRPEAQEDDEQLFAFEDIQLPDVGTYSFSLEFCDEDGEPIYAFNLRMRRMGEDEILRSTGSALSNPTVLAKDIYLEVVRDGKAARQQLLASGTSLPADGSFRFYTADTSGAVILRLFQNRFPIRTIHLEIPKDTPVGTAVELSLSVDESMSIVAGGEVLGASFWAQIEPPPARELKGWEEIEQLMDRAESLSKQLWGLEARFYLERITPLLAGIRETARTDPDKLQVLVARLEDVVEDYQDRDQELTPSYGRYVMLLDAVRRIVYRGDEGQRHLGLSTDEWRQRLAGIEKQAESAYQSRDQRAWSQSFNQVQAIYESLAQDEYRFDKGDPKVQVSRMHDALSSRLQELQTEMAGFTFAANPETKTLQEDELRRLQGELQTKVAGPLASFDPTSVSPPQAKAQLDRHLETLNYINRQFERLPTLGLVRQ